LPLEFFTKLQICFEETINRFPGLKQKVQEFIPCVRPDCPGFDRETLVLELADGRREIRCQSRQCRREHKIETLLYGLRLSGLEKTIEAMRDDLGRLLQEFNMLTSREQSRLESRCPSLFTLEYNRLPANLPSLIEGWRGHLTDEPIPARLSLWCQHPGDCHEVISYQIKPPGRRLAELAPLMKEAQKVLGPLAPLLGKTPNMKDLAEGWTDRLSKPMELLEETGDDPRRAYGTALVALRQILTECAPGEVDCWGRLRQVLLLKSQYLWVCEEHAKHPDYQP
jgi:hypothetical protein